MDIGGEMRNRGVSIVLGSFNRLTFLKLTIESIRQELSQGAFPAEIIVVDGGSTDGTLKWLINQKDIITIVQHNRGAWRGKKVERRSWGYFMNLGFKCAQGKYICMLSDDSLVVPGAIKNGHKLFEEKLEKGENVGAVAFFWRDWSETEKYFVVRTLGSKMMVNHGLYLNSAVKEVGYIDENLFMFYHADADLSLKLWQHNHICIASEGSFIEHFSHANTKVRVSNEKSIHNDFDQLLKKWGYIKKDLEKEEGPIYLEYKDPFNTAGRFNIPLYRKIISRICPSF